MWIYHRTSQGVTWIHQKYSETRFHAYTQDTAEGMLRSVLQKVFENAGGPIDHVPPVLYEFEINCSKRVDDRENVYSRVANMPSLINLGN